MTEVRKGYIGWELSQGVREALLEKFPPAYPRVVAHHCTWKFGIDSTTALPTETSAIVVGWVDDNQGLQALVLSIGGTTTRPDGGTYHITWSLNPPRKPVESNEVIKQRGWDKVSPPVRFGLVPKFFPFGGKTS